MSWRITTWNLQGSYGADLDFICAHIRDQRSDIFVVQEATARQARRLAQRLGMHHLWARKHTSFPYFSEGLAVLTPHRIATSTTNVLTVAPLWSWRRRIILRTHIECSFGTTLDLINVHLSPHDAAERRAIELTHLASLGADVVVGDFNAEVDAVARTLHPLTDTAPGSSPTCWTAGLRRGRRPTQRLDGILAAPTFVSRDPHTPYEDLDRWAQVSDHLPVTVTVERNSRSANQSTNHRSQSDELPAHASTGEGP